MLTLLAILKWVKANWRLVAGVIVVVGLVALGWQAEVWREGAGRAAESSREAAEALKKAEKAEEKIGALKGQIDKMTTKRIGDTFDAVVKAPLSVPAPVYRVCRAGVPATTPATGQPDDKAPSGGGDPGGSPPVWDSTPVVTIGRDADAQIAGLQDYITNVCRSSR